MRPIRATVTVLLVLIPAVQAPPLSAQIPDEFTNLQVLPDDISRDSLVALMRGFSLATGLRCDDCHVMGESGGFRGARFDLDDKLAKRRARAMLTMMREINGSFLDALPERGDDGLVVECKTCHRGLRKPFLLRTEMLAVLDAEGIDAAVVRYRELRDERMELGAYDLREGALSELARELAGAGRLEEAAALYELNEEYHPRSPLIPRALGGVYERLGLADDAVAAYRRALGLEPRDRQSLARLRALLGGGGEGG